MDLLLRRCEIAAEAAKRAGAYLKGEFAKSRPSGIRYKGKIDIVTDCDIEAQRVAIDTLRSGFPSDVVLAEESNNNGPRPEVSDYWIVDPLDGTNNFSRGIPHFCVSIAFVSRHEIALGVVYAPILDELYSSVRSRGATLNGLTIHVSRTTHLREAIIASGFPYDLMGPQGDNLSQWSALVKRVRAPRCAGAAALDLCYVACGRYDAHWESDLEPWDMAAGAIMVTEAGGEVTSTLGEAFDPFRRSVLATNQVLHSDMLALLSSSPADPVK
jgi:myo-inositol-1(or 4)-monophosphatase